ncbi:purine and uridine phosphorylase, partial [Viridothelium virens]
MKCSDYTVGWICAVHVEYVVAAGMLDEEHDDQMQPLTEWDDENSYTFGRIGPHNVVITCLPIGKYGIAAAAVAATHMKRSFKCIRMGLMVGIGGGVPSKNHDVRLGDIVIGACAGLTGSVLDYDHGKVMPDGKLQLTKHTDKPPSVLLNALSKLRRDHELRGNMIVSYIKDMMEKNRLLQSERRYNRPPPEEDRLYETSYQHVNEDLRCAECCEPRLVNRGRSRMNPDNPVVHYGRIASASKLMKDARYRDQMADEHEVLCFEMEAAGLDDFHCLIIRGICDYADSHKNDTWQGYAAAAAAGYAKELLHAIPSKAI